MKERHWTNLVTSLKCGQCVLVLGPEIPSDAPCSTRQLAYSDALKIQLQEELEEENNTVSATCLAGVAQHYEDAKGFGPAALRTVAAQFYGASKLEPSAIHQAIAALPFSLVVNTCHDRLLEAAMEKAGKTPLKYRYNFRGDRRDNPEFVLPWSSASPLIYHLFGEQGDPQSLVLSENDLLDFMVAVISEQPPLPNSLRRAMQRAGQSILFVGFGLRHWYLRVLMKTLIKTLTRGAANQASNSFALEPLLHGIPDNERQQTILFYQRGTQVKICNNEINDFFDELSRRLQEAGGETSQKAASVGPRPPQVFVSYASEDHQLAVRLFSALQKAGLEPWLDKDGLRGGEDWNAMIEDQLRESDYVLILQTPALARKRVSYVNKEISIAREQSRSYRGVFLIPLVTDNLSDEDRLEELLSFQQMPLKEATFDQDVAALVSTLVRDFQLRQR